MDALKQILEANGISIEGLEEKVKSLGFDPSNLSDEEVGIIANELISKGSAAISQTKKSKVAKSNGKNPQDASLDVLLANLAGDTNAEVEALHEAAQESVGAWANEQSDRLLGVVANAPTTVLQMFAEKAAQHEANPEFFRERGREFFAQIFVVSGDNG